MVNTPKETAATSYKIVHLSDLHFGGAFDADLWDYVKSLVIDLRPRLIIVSGDLVETPSPLLLLQAKRELEHLAQQGSSELFVIPGNHDIAVKGNVRAPYLSRLFWRIFKNETAAIKQALPPTPWLVDPATRPARQWFRRSRLLVGWMRNQFSAARHIRRTRLGEPSIAEIHKPYSDSHVFVMPFDSNRKVWLATGYVDRGDISYATTELKRRTNQRDPDFRYALRIAVVHHHPVPIPFAIVKEGALSFEPFLVFRNAGEFLRNLADQSFDLILHGHHHFYNFSRLALGAEGQSTELGILSAGSATIRYDEPGRNSFNVLSITPNGRVEITPYFLGGGKFEFSDPPRGFNLHTVEGLKLRNYKRAVEFQELSREEVALDLIVDEFGTERMSYRVKGLCVSGSYTTDGRTFELAVKYGRPVKATFMLDSECLARGFGLQNIHPEAPNEIRRRITFGRNLTAGTQSADYSFSWRTQNSLMLTNWEAEQLDRIPVESLFFDVSVPVRKLRLTLQLPSELHDLQPYVECNIPPSYPNLPLDDEREVDVRKVRTVDPEISEFESAHFRKVTPGVWALEVDYPMVGYQYAIRWNLATRPDQRGTPLIAGEVRLYRRLLIRYGEGRRKGGAANSATIILERFFADTRKLYATQDPDEELTLSLMAYDEAQKRLRLVDSIGTSPRTTDWDFSLRLGDGIAGAAFKQRKALQYAVAMMRSTPGGDAYLAPDNGGDRIRYEALLSFPMFHPRESDAARGLKDALPDDTIGVMTLGSSSPGSALLKFFEEIGRSEKKRAPALGEISQRVFEEVLKVVLSEMDPSGKLGDGEADGHESKSH